MKKTGDINRRDFLNKAVRLMGLTLCGKLIISDLGRYANAFDVSNPLNPLHPLNPSNASSPLSPLNPINPLSPSNPSQYNDKKEDKKSKKEEENYKYKRPIKSYEDFQYLR